MRKFLIISSIFCFVAISFFSCDSSKNLPKNAATELEMLQKMMAGKYNSAEQAKADTDYFNISLVMQPIWAETHRRKMAICGTSNGYQTRKTLSSARLSFRKS